jgi:NADH:ubiquinone oxidoreductase subunit 3 (subunit A)
MTDTWLLFSPFAIFIVALAAAILLYWWGGLLAPPLQPYGHKLEMYTGGEAPRSQEIRPSYSFFHIALFFTVLHVAAVVLVTAPLGSGSLIALIYLAILSIAVAALAWR